MVRKAWLLAAVLGWVLAGWAGAPSAWAQAKEGVKAAVPAVQAKINVNKAGPAELASLPGIGDATSKAILDYRQANGPFKKVDDLVQVKGIGEKKLEAIRGLVSVE
ncbi:MAG: ComEA family DNA-binding protein [Deferrisomatales bacterium]